MNIVILDDYQDAVRKLQCASKLDAYPAKVYTNTVKGIGQLSVRLKDADVVVRPVLTGVSSSDFSSRKRSIEAGRQAMLQALQQLRSAIAAKSR